MAIKKLQNDYTTQEQSKRLLELGVPEDSANYYLLRTRTKGDTFIVKVLQDELYSRKYKFTNMLEYFPCWSAGRLIEIICNCHVITNQLVENWICCDKNTNLIELLIGDIEGYVNAQHIDFSKLEECCEHWEMY